MPFPDELNGLKVTSITYGGSPPASPPPPPGGGGSPPPPPGPPPPPPPVGGVYVPEPEALELPPTPPGGVTLDWFRNYGAAGEPSRVILKTSLAWPRGLAPNGIPAQERGGSSARFRGYLQAPATADVGFSFHFNAGLLVFLGAEGLPFVAEASAYRVDPNLPAGDVAQLWRNGVTVHGTARLEKGRVYRLSVLVLGHDGIDEPQLGITVTINGVTFDLPADWLHPATDVVVPPPPPPPPRVDPVPENRAPDPVYVPRLLHPDAFCYQPTDHRPAHPRSAELLQFQVSRQPANDHIHFDPTLAANVVPLNTPFGPFTSVQTADESDPPGGPFGLPVPTWPLVGEGGSDQHILVYREGDPFWTEAQYAPRDDSTGTYSAEAVARFELGGMGDERPLGWTSADAAGLPIWPFLFGRRDVVTVIENEDEGLGDGTLEHMLRWTAKLTRYRRMLPPARHATAQPDALDQPDALPFGCILRIKPGVPEPADPMARVIFKTLQKYGAVLADNGAPGMVQGLAGFTPDETDRIVNALRAVNLVRDCELVDFAEADLLRWNE